MAFEFGVFHEFQRRPGQSEAAAFDTAFEQVDAAERWGLDAIWLAEIHMAPERSVCAVPLTLAYFLICGLRFVFDLPAEIRANWVHRVILDHRQPGSADAAERRCRRWPESTGV